MVATSDFSGLVSSAWASARAAAIVPIDSLDRCISTLHPKEVEADRARLGALGTDPMPDCFLGVFGHQALQFALGLFVLKKRIAGAPKDTAELCPGIRRTHVDDADGL